MPYLAYQGRTGIVWNVTPRAVGVEVNKQVRVQPRVSALLRNISSAGAENTNRQGFAPKPPSSLSQIGGRVARKRIHVRIEHVQHSKCRATSSSAARRTMRPTRLRTSLARECHPAPWPRPVFFSPGEREDRDAPHPHPLRDHCVRSPLLLFNRPGLVTTVVRVERIVTKLENVKTRS